MLFTPGPWFVRFSLVRFSFVRNFKTPPKYLVRAQSFIGARNNEGNKHQWKQWAPMKAMSTNEGNKHEWRQCASMKTIQAQVRIRLGLGQGQIRARSGPDQGQIKAWSEPGWVFVWSYELSLHLCAPMKVVLIDALSLHSCAYVHMYLIDHLWLDWCVFGWCAKFPGPKNAQTKDLVYSNLLQFFHCYDETTVLNC